MLGGVFDADLLEERDGIVIVRVTGKTAEEDFAKEGGGGRRWQRVPPTEKRGRRQTSTVTVAFLREPKEAEVRLDERDLMWKATRGSGPGGQSRQKNDTAIQLTHKPSGLMVRAETERSQFQNRQLALGLLRARLFAAEQDKLLGDRNATRKAQLGGGCRGDKAVTISLFRDTAISDVSGKRISAARYMRGFIEDLW